MYSVPVPGQLFLFHVVLFLFQIFRSCSMYSVPVPCVPFLFHVVCTCSRPAVPRLAVRHHLRVRLQRQRADASRRLPRGELLRTDQNLRRRLVPQLHQRQRRRRRRRTLVSGQRQRDGAVRRSRDVGRRQGDAGRDVRQSEPTGDAVSLHVPRIRDGREPEVLVAVRLPRRSALPGRYPRLQETTQVHQQRLSGGARNSITSGQLPMERVNYQVTVLAVRC